MEMTPTERKLFKEAIIKEYKLKHESKKKQPNHYELFLKNMRKILPINIVVGMIACAGLVYIQGWMMLLYVFLSGIIWVTLISTIVGTFFNKN